MIEQAVDLRQESEALYRLIEPIDESAYAVETQFKAWTTNDVIGHLHIWNRAADLSLTDAHGFRTFLEKLAEDVMKIGMRKTEAKRLEGLQGRRLLEAWRRTCLEVADHFAQADPRARVPWAGPDMSARSSITARLMETWAHGQEVYDRMGAVRVNTDRIKNIVVLGVNTFHWSFRVHGLEPPGPLPHLKLTAPSGEVWEWGDDATGDRIEGAAEAFCQVVTQVRNIADTDLEVTGETATRWMSIAQCFAGPPETPPLARHTLHAGVRPRAVSRSRFHTRRMGCRLLGTTR